MTRSDLTTAPFGPLNLVIGQSPPDWFRPTLEGICALGELRQNWDSYGAKPVDPRCAESAIMLLLSIMGPNTPVPAVVPTSRGGLQLEWHTGGIDFEIEVNSPSRFHAVFEDNRTGEEWEKVVTSDLRPLKSSLERLSM
jgi:hypothetical protein